MFKCEVTKKQSRSGEKSYKLVVETRPKQYKALKRNKMGDTLEVVIGEGTEIAKELTVCEEVYKKYMGDIK